MIAGVLLLPSSVGAQRRLTIAFDATAGRSFGHTGGEYRDDRQGLTADLLLAAGFAHGASGRLLAGVSASAHGTGVTTSECRPAADGSCVPGFPDFEQVGVLAGWEHRPSRIRGLAGPAYVRASGDWESWRLAWQARVDGAIPLARHVAAVGSIRGTLVPSYQGDSFTLVALAVGVRIH